jgi:hypothetical protein
MTADLVHPDDRPTRRAVPPPPSVASIGVRGGDLLHAIDHRSDQGHSTCWLTWPPLLRCCPLVTAADWGRVPRLCPTPVRVP